jgi:hypothetical protein
VVTVSSGNVPSSDLRLVRPFNAAKNPLSPKNWADCEKAGQQPPLPATKHRATSPRLYWQSRKDLTFKHENYSCRNVRHATKAGLRGFVRGIKNDVSVVAANGL